MKNFCFLLISTILFLPKISAQDCSNSTGLAQLDANNVRCIVLGGGDMFWDLNNARYEVPKANISAGEISKHSIFAAAIWMGGMDDQGNLHTAAQTYRQTGVDFFPGIINENNEAACENLDHVFSIKRSEIDTFLGTDFSNPPQKILEWPAKNNPYYANTSLDLSSDLAPFVDANGDDIYDPTTGDFPLIKGDESTLCIYNDIGNVHSVTGGLPLGVEIIAKGHAFASDDYLNNTTFWEYEIRYKGTEPLYNYQFGFWCDPDLGNYLDDYVGCYPQKNTAFVYNADTVDDGTTGYGVDIPVLSFTFLEGIKNQEGEDMGLTSFIHYDNNNMNDNQGLNEAPNTAADFYAYLNGNWKNGNPMTYGGNGFGSSTQQTMFMYDGNPNDESQWSECSAEIGAGDVTFLMSTGGVTLMPGDVQEVSFAVVWGDPANFEYPCPDIHSWVDKYHNGLVEFNNQINQGYDDLLTTNAPISSQEVPFNVSPNPATDFVEILYDNSKIEANFIEIWSVSGQLMQQVSLDENTNTQKIELSKLANGLYFLKLKNNQNQAIAVQKLVVHH